ncbi:MAG: lipoyl(octanoyl) transferase LipB, partial [Gemmatimonadales bacterium]
GPGLLVGYPILDLNRWKRDLHCYLRQLEQTLIDALSELGLTSFRYPAFTGVWVGDESAVDDSGRATGQVRKIASIGVHVSRWVTWHGFALNVTDEPLRNFDLIVPCGIDEVRMTTLQSEGAIFDRKAVSRAIGRGLAGAFECEVRTAPPVLAGDRPALDAACVTAGLR